MDEDDRSKKMASEIRAATESTEFDLAGYGPEQCERLAAAAFSKPLPIADMIRLSFLVGGGKKVRQKYNDGLPALWSDALKKVGFAEDRGASLDKACAGLFKFQHNTDTDLKTTHVYPRIDTEAAAALRASSATPEESALSPKQLVLLSDLEPFKRMVGAKVASLAQKRRVHDLLKSTRAGLAASEAKMASLEALTEAEQQQYDTLDASVLEEKQQWLAKQMEAMIDGGQLDASERSATLAQLTSKLEQLEEQVALAESEGKAKRAEKLRSLLAELQGRVAKVRDLKPVVRKLPFEKEIKQARLRLAELEKLENSKVVLPLEQVQRLNAKPKLVEDLTQMLAESKGWFAEDDSVSLD